MASKGRRLVHGRLQGEEQLPQLVACCIPVSYFGQRFACGGHLRPATSMLEIIDLGGSDTGQQGANLARKRRDLEIPRPSVDFAAPAQSYNGSLLHISVEFDRRNRGINKGEGAIRLRLGGGGDECGNRGSIQRSREADPPHSDFGECGCGE